MPRHLTLAELREGLPEILRSPKDHGTLAGIVIRPEKGVRRELDSCELSLALGVRGANSVKVCRSCIGLIAQQRGNRAPAGDNPFIDLDLINRTGGQ